MTVSARDEASEAVDRETGIRRLVRAAALSERFSFFVVECRSVSDPVELRAALEHGVPSLRKAPGEGETTVAHFRPRATSTEPLRGQLADLLEQLVRGTTATLPPIVILDATWATSAGEVEDWRWLFRRLNELRNDLARAIREALVLCALPRLFAALPEEAPDLWSIRTSSLRLRPALHEALGFPREALSLESLAKSMTTSEQDDPDDLRAEIARLGAQGGEPSEERAVLLSRLARSLMARKSAPEAIAPAEEAVAIFRALAQSDSERLTPRLGRALEELALLRAGAGDLEGALASASEGVALLRRLAQAQPSAYLHHLSGILAGQGMILAAMGRLDDALTSTREAVEVLRALADVQANFLRALARTLESLGGQLLDAGRHEEATVAAKESVSLWRGLAEADPNASLPSLAASLDLLARSLIPQGDLEEALLVTQEAVSIQRRLVAVQTDVHTSGLAFALVGLGIVLAALDRPDEALVAFRETVDILRSLASSQPQFLSLFGKAVGILGRILIDIGRPEETLAATTEAVDIFRRLEASQPDHFRLDMALALRSHAEALRRVGREQESLTAIKEAAEIEAAEVGDKPV